MCLLTVNKADTEFSDMFLSGVYDRNSDGIGVMYAEGDVLHYSKAVCTNRKEFIKFYRDNVEGRDCAWHARMKTHGRIDLENCHPYPVFGFDDDEAEVPMLMMHNGILSTDNHKDRSRSDTWHYVRDYLRPILQNDPAILHQQAFQAMLAAHIGSGNKFVLMDHTGKPVIINEKAFIEYEGALLSNTYAWDYYTLHPKAPRQQTTPAYRGYDYGNDWDTDGYKGWNNRATKTYPAPQPKYPTTTVPRAPAKKDPDDEVIHFAERVLEISSIAYESISAQQIRRLFKEFGTKDIEAWVNGFEDGVVKEDAFIAGLKDPRKVRDWLCFSDTSLFSAEYAGA